MTAHFEPLVETRDRNQGSVAGLLRQGLSAHAIFFVIAIGYLAALRVTGLLLPEVANSSMLELAIGILTFSIPAAFLAFTLYTFGNMVLGDRPDKPAKVLWQRMKAVLGNPRKMAAGLPLFFSLIIFMFAFTAFKANIPVLVPYSWDVTFDQWDTAIHFGHRPWELMQPVFGFAPLTWALNVNYNLWFFTMNIFWVHYAFVSAPGKERTRFFLAFMLITAVLGTLAATVFSSAGPAYMTRLGISPDPYADLMAYLQQVNQSYPLWALDTQDMLWNYKQEGSVFGGISAMPSIHNATALLFVLAVWKKAPVLRWIMVVHAILIFLASVHLGWHYAVDSYVAWPIAAALWWCAGRLSTWWEARPHVQNFNKVVGHD